MAETEFGDYIVGNYATIVSVARALICAGTLDPSDTAAACRTTAESMSDDGARTHLLAFAARWEAAKAGAERLLAPGWTPEVIAGGKDGGGKDGGD